MHGVSKHIQTDCLAYYMGKEQSRSRFTWDNGSDYYVGYTFDKS